MASQQGIQQLLQAEQRAQEIIGKARKGILFFLLSFFLSSLRLHLEKITLLKAAKDEADKEVAAFRSAKEAEFQDYVRKVCCLSMMH
jgi:hypothetical protein